MAPTRIPAEEVDASPLGQPLAFEFSGKVAPNRFLKGAMTERQSSWSATDLPSRGVPSRELVNLYRRWGEGGWGLILTGNVMIDWDQLESPGNAIVHKSCPPEGERFERFAELATEGKKHGSLIIAQVGHPGRQVSAAVNPNPISASDVQLVESRMGIDFAKPREMEQKDIDEVIEGFAYAAEYLYKAGFDGVQLHAAHGYLLSQFLSPTTNKRTDKYGGSIQNRGRIVFEAADAIRKRVPSTFSVGIKVNSVEFQDGGFTPEDCKLFCVDLEKHDIDFVELSGGNYQQTAFVHKRESTKKRESFFLDFAEMIIPQLTKTKVYVTGGFKTVGAMVKAVESVHGVGLGRPAAHEIDFPKQVLESGVKSVIAVLMNDQDFQMTNVAAGTQMKLVGMDKQTLDMSDEKHMEVFVKSMGQYLERMKNNDGSQYGFADIIDYALNSYGTPYC